MERTITLSIKVTYDTETSDPDIIANTLDSVIDYARDTELLANIDDVDFDSFSFEEK